MSKAINENGIMVNAFSKKTMSVLAEMLIYIYSLLNKINIFQVDTNLLYKFFASKEHKGKQ